MSAGWLDHAIRSAGLIDGASVTGFESEAIGEGVGVMCVLHRITPVYEGAHPEAPGSVILKVPVDQEATRFVARTFRFYEMEVEFYRTAATISPLVTPGCLAAEHDPETDDFVLLLEDLTGARTYSQVEGCPPDVAEICVKALARHHAAFWDSEVLDEELSWLPYPWDPPVPDAIQAGAAASLPTFFDGFGHRFDARIRALCERFAEVTGELFNFGDDRPLTFVHGDYHVGNLFFRDDEVVAFDWQFPLRTAGA